MTDDIGRRLRGLVDDIEPTVTISPANATRRRGDGIRVRRRAATGVAVAAAIAAITTGFTALDNREPTPASAAAASGNGATPPPTACPPRPGVPASVPPSQVPPPAAGEPAQVLPPALGLPTLVSPPATGGDPVQVPPPATEGACGAANGTYGPLSPQALTVADLPETSAGTWRPNDANPGSWTGTAADIPIAPGAFCLGATWVRPNAPFEEGTPDIDPATPLSWSSYTLASDDQPAVTHGGLNETIATFATEAEAEEAMGRLVDLAVNCAARQGGMATVTPITVSPTLSLWKWTDGDAYTGHDGIARSGRTIVTLSHLQTPTTPPTPLTPTLLQTALTRATTP
ncbi:hypothetical protein LO772_14880 [Yinghuangia sp. ASG 101]|uniref:hypothetical protein n=1 Tax=Yinghuangia sp. ASG 101 TaxID=2896848 RepID=UPI001E44760C|nr:hypothetical protein [Yinghuangia sp. ASG 101]UGQ15719.1 hypothetical protein LO772_14880 [Yinghuangia sp. ASG 101]